MRKYWTYLAILSWALANKETRDRRYKVQRINTLDVLNSTIDRADISWITFLQYPNERFSYDNITRDKFIKNGIMCGETDKSSLTCPNQWNEDSIPGWTRNVVKEPLCEPAANSKITCMDSIGGSAASRLCIFENAMLDFNKMKTKEKTGKRSWERGFLSADCGFSAPENIGYFPLYSPDIHGGGEVLSLC